MAHEPRLVTSPFWTPGVLVMFALVIGGALALLARYVGGLGYATNLTDAYPWGLWIAVDVASGVALAAGGFTTAFVAHVLHRERYHAIVRPALLTAALGYTFVAFGVFVDIGRSWAIWKFFVFQNHLSPLFEVGMCVLAYLAVLWIELLPVAAERFGGRILLLAHAKRFLDKTMWVFLLLGVVLSCMHQSSLGTLLLIAPTKISPLWYTPILPLLFLTSAFAVGYPMVIVETTIVTTSLKRDDEMEILSPLSRITVVLLGLYMVLRLGDLIARGAYASLLDGSAQSMSFLVEVGLGVIVPWCMLLSATVRRSRRALFTAALMIVLGVLLNRVNAFIIGFTPPYAEAPYFPSAGELLVTIGAASAIFLLYRVFVTYLPVLTGPEQEA
jgi:Ni/Fe-hydrogenase subunit HybB-like protein